MDRDVPRLSADTPFEQAKNELLNSKYRGLPVFRDDVYIGMVSRRSFIERPRRKLIMVDHNEISQAVDGAELAEILEIVDHHRLAPPSTRQPIAVTTRAVGSTCTLVYEEFAGRGLGVDADVAVLLLSGIISDTVNLQSPTTTEPDRRAIYRLETITGISASEHAKRLFAQLNALENREPKEIILSDYKQYTHEGDRVCDRSGGGHHPFRFRQLPDASGGRAGKRDAGKGTALVHADGNRRDEAQQPVTDLRLRRRGAASPVFPHCRPDV